MTKNIVSKNNKGSGIFFIIQFLVIVLAGSIVTDFMLVVLISPPPEEFTLFPFLFHPLAPYVWILLTIINLIYIFVFQKSHKLHGKLKIICYLAGFASLFLLALGSYFAYFFEEWLV